MALVRLMVRVMAAIARRGNVDVGVMYSDVTLDTTEKETATAGMSANAIVMAQWRSEAGGGGGDGGRECHTGSASLSG